eukprot:CAMPEP_0197893012 /NCGR_PEP_ID=MMETSP1439-20131203/32337_1 /TAXON_ID=66791 /ORGANISM="Gonyaulax spinifera, Strain CCMP409" /LENGTH=106 /DNA_ID=CAMNT_0043513247 /DNA_START=83 /DNA_END=403 /DNA_ORIENTATION=+
MKVTVRCTSGSYDLDVADSATVADLLKAAMEKHKPPRWANGVQLLADGQEEDLAEDSSRALGAFGVAAGASLRMAYYQDVTPAEAKKLKFQGVEPHTAMPFLVTKA